jgi:hypothetical protein
LEVAFLKSEIERQDNNRVKRALQSLCKSLRHNIRVSPQDINGLETSILGALIRGTSDEKVRRWALSALSLCGRPSSCLEAVTQVLKTRTDEPQVMSAAIAALFKMKPQDAQDKIKSLDIISPEIAYLSALQTLPQASLKGSVSPINFENSDNLTLKLSLLLVGMNKAPDNLFHAKYTNPEIVRELEKNGDTIVSQYSVWAAAENPNLGAKDVDLDLSRLTNRNSNERSYIYRLYASEKEYSPTQHEVILVGKSDEDTDARMGCAIGLRDTYYEGIESLVMDWYFNEADEETRHFLIDHTVRNTDKSDQYHSWAKELYDEFESDRAVLNRMKSQSVTLPIYTHFKKIDAQRETGFLFPEGTNTVTNYNFNNTQFQGQTSVGGGKAENSGHQDIGSQSQDNRAIITKTIREAQRAISDAPLNSTLKTETLAALEKAEQSPDVSNIEKAAKLLEKCGDALGSVEGMAKKVTALGGYATALLSLFGLI